MTSRILRESIGRSFVIGRVTRIPKVVFVRAGLMKPGFPTLVFRQRS